MPTLPYIEFAPFLPAFPDPVALLTTPAFAHTAVAMGGVFFLLNASFTVLLLGTSINWGEVRELLAPSLIGVVAGALTAVRFPPQLLYWLVVTFIGIYMLKLTGIIKDTPIIFESTPIVGGLTGLIQGLGVSASSIRTGLFYAKNYTLAAAWSTTAFVGMSNFTAATLLRLATGQVTPNALVPIVFYAAIPIFIYKLGERYAAHNLHYRYVKPLILLLLSLAGLLALMEALSL